MNPYTSRRDFLKQASMGVAMTGLGRMAAAENTIPGFDDHGAEAPAAKGWEPVSGRKVRMGIVGNGVCHFGAEFSLQNHPNVEVVAVSDLFPERCAALAEKCRCEKTYPSLEELVLDDGIEAVFVATDAPSHARHCMDVLNHGKHVATAVPASFGSLEEAEQLYETVKRTGLKYMMFETSCFRDDCYAMRTLYEAGKFGPIVYSEGEYYHYSEKPIDSFRGWREGPPPLWYPTHSTAYLVGVSGEHFTEVSCMGMPSQLDYLHPENNRYGNPFGTEIALLRTSGGGMSRMLMSKDTPGHYGEKGRVRGQLGSMTGTVYEGIADISGIDIVKPALPPGVEPGGHGGSHGYLGNEFVMAILEDRTPLVDISKALNMTVCGIVAHDSAMKGGETLKVPHYAPLG